MKTTVTYLEDICDVARLRTGDVLINFCNCRCEWRSDWQQSLKRACQNAYIADLNTRKGDATKLGMVTWAKERNGVFVVNLYCYIEHTKEPLTTIEENLYRGLKVVHALFPKSRVVVPAHVPCILPRWHTSLMQQLHSVLHDRDLVLYVDGK